MGLQSVHNALSLPLLPPHTLPLLQHGVPPTGDSPSQTSPVWVLPTGCSSSRMDCFHVGPPWGHKSCQQTCFGMGSSLHGSTGPQVLPGSCSGVGFPRGHSVLRASTCSGVGSSLHGLQVDICSTVELHGLPGDSLPHHGLPHGLQGNLCSGAWSTSSPSFFTDLGVCRAVSLTYSHSSLRLQLLLCSNFSPFLNLLSQRRYHRR